MNEYHKHISTEEKLILNNINNNKRISIKQALYLFKHSSNDFCRFLANRIRENKHDRKLFYNRNVHIEVSNICINKCRFCSFGKDINDLDTWDMSLDEVINFLHNKSAKYLTEVHIVGGLHPNKTSNWFSELFIQIKKHYSHIHIKAFTAVEIEFFSIKDNLSTIEILKKLIDSGMNSIAGGGAEILDDNIRKIICPEKTDSETWLRIHKEAHELGLKTNATMLYGHIESYEDRIKHMEKIRKLQDISNGFNCFIPLKYNNKGKIKEVNIEISAEEELKNYAISRIYFDNIPHIKAYWPMCGKNTAFKSLEFGVDDMDGTINDSTKIYSMAGNKEQNPEMSVNELKAKAKECGYIAIERDSSYNEIF